MLIQPFWLTCLLFIVSATTHAVPPIGLHPRYLSTGTAISLTTPPPYPTTSTDAIAIPTTTTYPSPPSIPSTSPPAAPTSTPSSDFHLIASGTGTYLDGYYLTIGQSMRGAGHGDLQVMSFIPSLPAEQNLDLATFHLAANNTLVVNALGGGDGKSFGWDMNDYWFFNSRPILETYDVYESVCEIVAGELKCVTGLDTLFYVCVEVFATGPYAGEPVNDRDLLPLLGREVDESCNGVPLTVLVVPV